MEKASIMPTQNQTNMQKSYKVVGSNGAHSALMNTVITGEQTPIAGYINFFSFIVGDIDYDLEIQMDNIIAGQKYLWCCLTSEEKCGNVVLEEIKV